MGKNNTAVIVLYLPKHGMYAHLQYSTDANTQLTELLNTSLDIAAKLTFSPRSVQRTNT